MLRHPTLEKLQTLRLTGMVAAFQEHLQLPEVNTLSFEERLGLLVDRNCSTGRTGAYRVACGKPSSGNRPP